MVEDKIISKLQQYATYLENEINGMERVINNESMLGSISAEHKRDGYIASKDKLYELFPELIEEIRKIARHNVECS